MGSLETGKRVATLMSEAWLQSVGQTGSYCKGIATNEYILYDVYLAYMSHHPQSGGLSLTAVPNSK